MLASLKPVFASLCLLGLCSFGPAYAAQRTQSQQLAEDVHSIALQTQKIEQQMLLLQKEMGELHAEQVRLKHRQDSLMKGQARLSHEAVVEAHQAPQPVPAHGASIGQAHYTRATQGVPVQFDHKAPDKEKSFHHHSKYYKEEESPYFKEHPEALPYSGMHNLAKIGGTAIITTPFIQSNYTYKGSDLIVNYSSIKKYIASLKQRQAFVNHMAAEGFRIPKLPLLEVSGKLAVKAFGQSAFNNARDTDIDISGSELDFQALVNKWVTGFMSIGYDNGFSQTGRRVTNSNVALDTAFVTLGNFNKSPLYANAGQEYAPFGSFNSNMTSDTLAKILFRTKSRLVVLGYHHLGASGLDTSIYMGHGDSRRGDYKPLSLARSRNTEVNLFGADLSYHAIVWDSLHATFGASVINNVADASGMQATGALPLHFKGFAYTTATEVLQHLVPAVDVRAVFDYGAFRLIGEYDMTTRAFDARDITFNGKGADISAGHVEGDFAFKLFSWPSSFGVSLGDSREALAFNVPLQRFMATFNTSIWEHTVCSLEYRYDVNYGKNDKARGTNGGLIFGRPGGKYSNAVTGEFDVYF